MDVEPSKEALFNEVYDKLGILLTDDDLAGESMYQPSMPTVLERLAAAGLLDESDGAKVVWVPGFVNRDGEPLPLIAALTLDIASYASESCPLCANGDPIGAPGSSGR